MRALAKIVISLCFCIFFNTGDLANVTCRSQGLVLGGDLFLGIEEI